MKKSGLNNFYPHVCFRRNAALLVPLVFIRLAANIFAAPVLPDATNLWAFPFVSSKPYNSSQTAPALATDGTVYVGTFDGTFYAVTPDGKEKWRFKAGREIKSSPAVAADGTIYFGSRDRNFYAVTPTGKLKWRFGTGAWVDSAPAIAGDGTIYFGSWDKNFYALNPDGSQKWKLAIGAIVESSPAVAADGTIYFGAHDKKFYALAPDGRTRWTFLTGGEIVSSPAVGAGGVIYFSSLDGNLYALNSDGSERWRYHTDSTTESSPIVDADGIIYIGQNQVMEVISPDGKKLWHNGGGGVATQVSAAAVPGWIYFPTARSVGAMVPVDHCLWSANVDDNISASLTVGPDGTVYVCAGDTLHAVRPPGAAMPPAKSPWPMFRANAQHTGLAGN